jgi:hypothetical protein
VIVSSQKSKGSMRGALKIEIKQSIKYEYRGRKDVSPTR